MSKLVTIYGGAGFVGRYIAQRMAKEGWRVRVATRRPNEAMFVSQYGAVGQVEAVLCNIRDENSVRSVMKGADAVVNCVGLLNELGANTFEAVQHDGAGRVAQIATEEKVAHLVHFSAIGANPDSDSEYARTKGLGEADVLAGFPAAVILRPSVIFGAEDKFFNKFAKMALLGPVLALVGGHTKFQPVSVDDVAQAAVLGILGQAVGTYELGGPAVKTLNELVGEMLATIRRKRLVLNLPFWVGSIIGGALDIAQSVTLGLFSNGILTRDQVRNLRFDNVVSDGAKTLDSLGIIPMTTAAVLPEYLWCYRPSGQYSSIKDSAKNLKV